MTKLKKWQVLEESDVSPSKWFPLFKHKVKLPDGTIIDDYYISKLGDVAMIVAFTTSNEVVFVQQYKHGVGVITLELPAGRIENKDPLVAAKDELEEETGYVAEELELLSKIYHAPSKDSEVCYGYIVRNVETLIEQKLDVTEDIEVVLIPGNQVEDKIRSGEICASETLAILYLARLKAPELFKK